MNSKIKYILLLLVFIIVVITVFKIEFNSFNDYPTRPDKVSKTAIWAGGTDGGYWFDFVDYDKISKEYLIVIFEENKGEVVLDGKFIQKGNCNNLPIDNKILKKINYFANNEIVLDNCILVKVK